MNFSQIHSFYLVANLGTYQAAAERLHATQPAISARIAALEDSLKVRLFDRSGYRVSLTPEGERFLAYAEKLLELETESRLDIANNLDGVLRIGTSDTMVSTWLADFLLYFGKSHPEVGVEMYVRSSANLQEDLLSHSIDLAFLIGPVSNPTVINRKFCGYEMGFVAAPSLQLKEDIELKDLGELNLLTFGKMTVPYQHLKRLLRQKGVIPRLNSITALHSLIILTKIGLGVGYLPIATVEKELKTGRLVRVKVPLDAPPISFEISYLDGPRRKLAESITISAMSFLKDRAPTDSINLFY